MEVGLIHSHQLAKVNVSKSLNPCFRGSWFDTQRDLMDIAGSYVCLNPCFRGSWFDTT